MNCMYLMESLTIMGGVKMPLEQFLCLLYVMASQNEFQYIYVHKVFLINVMVFLKKKASFFKPPFLYTLPQKYDIWREFQHKVNCAVIQYIFWSLWMLRKRRYMTFEMNYAEMKLSFSLLLKKKAWLTQCSKIFHIFIN